MSTIESQTIETTRKPLTWFKLPEQIRKDPGSKADLLLLGNSMGIRQLAPVGAMEDGELLYGFRRVMAALMVGLSELLVIIYRERLSPSEIKLIQLTENVHRLDMSPWEKYRACEELMQLNSGWSARQLAEQLKLDPSAVTKLTSPSRCIPEWREALKAGKVSTGDCYAATLAESEEQQRQMLEMKLAGASRDALTRFVRQTKSKPESDNVRMARITVPMPSGTRVVLSGKNLSLTEIVQELSDCLEAARKGVRDRLDAKTWMHVMRDKSSAVKE